MFAGEFARKQYWQKLSEYSNFFKKKKKNITQPGYAEESHFREADPESRWLCCIRIYNPLKIKMQGYTCATTAPTTLFFCL